MNIAGLGFRKEEVIFDSREGVCNTPLALRIKEIWDKKVDNKLSKADIDLSCPLKGLKGSIFLLSGTQIVSRAKLEAIGENQFIVSSLFGKEELPYFFQYILNEVRFRTEPSDEIAVTFVESDYESLIKILTKMNFLWEFRNKCLRVYPWASLKPYDHLNHPDLKFSTAENWALDRFKLRPLFKDPKVYEWDFPSLISIEDLFRKKANQFYIFSVQNSPKGFIQISKEEDESTVTIEKVGMLPIWAVHKKQLFQLFLEKVETRFVKYKINVDPFLISAAKSLSMSLRVIKNSNHIITIIDKGI